MKKSITRRVLLLALAIGLLCSLALSASAAAGYASQGSPSTGIFCNISTYSTAAVVKPYTQTQVQHNKGIATTVGVSYTLTHSTTGSASFSGTVEVDFVALAYEAGAQAGVAYTASHSIDASVSFTVPAEEKSGRYRIEVVFPRDHVTITTGEYYITGKTNMKTYTIDVMPRVNDAFHRLTRYADAL